MSELQPSKQSVFKCLSNRSYDIDFYQREYVWSKEVVEGSGEVDIFVCLALKIKLHKVVF